MTSEIQIPVQVLLDSQSKKIDLEEPRRCSRCNAVPAGEWETHYLKYRAGLIRRRMVTRNFETIISFRLRLPLCEDCYRSSFIEAPETMTEDKNPLAAKARWRKAGLQVATLVTLISFLLLMKIIPLPDSPAIMKFLWLIVIGVAVLIYGITFGLAELQNRALKQELALAGHDPGLHRALAEAEVQAEEASPAGTAVTLTLKNDSWAEECAKKYSWKIQKKD